MIFSMWYFRRRLHQEDPFWIILIMSHWQLGSLGSFCYSRLKSWRTWTSFSIAEEGWRLDLLILNFLNWDWGRIGLGTEIVCHWYDLSQKFPQMLELCTAGVEVLSFGRHCQISSLPWIVETLIDPDVVMNNTCVNGSGILDNRYSCNLGDSCQHRKTGARRTEIVGL